MGDRMWLGATTRWRDQDKARRASWRSRVEKRMPLARMPQVQIVTWSSRFLQQVATPLVLPPPLDIASVQRAPSMPHVSSSRARNFEPAHASGVVAGFMRAFSQTPNIGHVRCLSLLGMLSSGGQTTTSGVSLTQWLFSNSFCCFISDVRRDSAAHGTLKVRNHILS